MIRQIIHINEEKCNGCGACANACHEGAIRMVNGKAKLIRDDYCDGMGDCLPACPTGAITFEEREALAYDEAAVMAAKAAASAKQPVHSGCPGSRMMTFDRNPAASDENRTASPSELRQWPVQIMLVPVNALYFEGADLLIAADCTAYAYPDFHRDFIRNRITLVGCPKLDSTDYSEKLREIFMCNDISSVTVARMEVPCCGGLENAVKKAVEGSGRNIPVTVKTISTDGRII